MYTYSGFSRPPTIIVFLDYSDQALLGVFLLA